MTTLVEKITRLVSGRVNDMVEQSANTGVEARQLVRDLGQKIDATNDSYVDVKATYVLLQNNLKDSQAKSATWRDNAAKAVTKKDDNLARECLEKKHTYDTQAQGYQNQIDAMKPQVELLETQLKALQDKHEEMSNRTDLMSARSETAQAQQKASSIIGSIASDNIGGEFDKLDKTVKKQEARAQVMMSSADQATGKDLQDSVDALDKKQTIDDELAQLKAAAPASTGEKAA